jgi:sarcosine oxidase subunit alpha
MISRRLAPPHGSRLDRTRIVSFLFDDKRYQGFQGDTLASALLAQGVRLFGRSFKLHRPRGVFSCGVEEPNALVDLGAGAFYSPNSRATVVELREGMVARSVNRWPSLRFDARAVNGLLSQLLPAGFYYKTFKWPNWHLYEPSIRRAAGLGRAPSVPDAERYAEIAAGADVVVVGGGLAGLAAAAAAAEAGAKVILLAVGAALGGAAECGPNSEVVRLSELCVSRGVQILTRTAAFGLYDHNLVCAREMLEQGERLWKIRARRIVLAAGALERPLLFPDNDRPGVMLAGAADRFAQAYGVACGARAVIAANSDRAYELAARLQSAGIEIAAIADARPGQMIGAAQAGVSGMRLLDRSVISAVHGAHGVRGCSVESGAKTMRIECDLLLSAGPPVPTVHLHSQAGGKLRWVEAQAMFVPDGSPPGIASVGACAGVFKPIEVLRHAEETGRAAARGEASPEPPLGGAGLSLSNTHVSRRGAKQFVDLQNDVTADDIALAARENYRSVEHLKRYTTLGMGTDQGKTSNVNALVLMGVCTGRSPDAVGTTKFRPPFLPVTMGLIAGRRVGTRFKPLKRLPAEAWHSARGAVLEDYGGWRRPAAYPVPGESIEVAALREARCVREAAGLFDGTPLGKLEVFGPDAATFLDRMYVGTLSTLKVGQARYGLLLDESGVVVDDGVIARLGDQRFWVNTTSAGIDRTLASFEEWLQCEFTDLRVSVTPVTSRWMNVTVAGPRAWEWLALAGLPSQLAPERMRHMTLVDIVFGGASLRVLRASFSGELGYELNVPVESGPALLDRLDVSRIRIGGVAYGVEALQILRIEKGYIHIGTDTDGTTLPGDIGYGRGINQKTVNFVGRRSLDRPVAKDLDRLQLVALEPVDGTTLLPVGAQIAHAPPPSKSEGHVTSSAISAALHRPIALGMLTRGFSRSGETVRLHHLGATIEARVTHAPFFDPKGDRLHG